MNGRWSNGQMCNIPKTTILNFVIIISLLIGNNLRLHKICHLDRFQKLIKTKKNLDFSDLDINLTSQQMCVYLIRSEKPQYSLHTFPKAEWIINIHVFIEYCHTFV